jgi:serine protease Do
MKKRDLLNKKFFSIFMITVSMPLWALNADKTASPAVQEAMQNLSLVGGPSFADILEQKSLLDAVVHISAKHVIKDKDKEKNRRESMDDLQGMPPYLEEFFRQFMPNGRKKSMQQFQSLGSGFIIESNTKEAIVITNNHVIEGANEITITLHAAGQHDKQNEVRLNAKIIGRDPKTDIAVLKVDTKGKNLKTVTFGDSSKMRIADEVYAIGSPFGLLNGTVTRGIISSLYRNIGVGAYDSFIQTDASITRGNSGGPLLNKKGEVIGINTAIATQGGGSEGLGFAIPSNNAKPIIDQLRKQGSVTRGWIGVAIDGVTAESAPSLGLDKPIGALVHSLDDKGPAKAAGLEAGDVLLKFDGQEITSVESLPKIVGLTPVGKEVEVVISRRNDDGKAQEKTLKLKVALLKDKPEDAVQNLDDKNQNSENKGYVEALGLMVQSITPELRERYDIKKDKKGQDIQGLVITGIDSIMARRKGLEMGDIILKADNVTVKSFKDIENVVKKAQQAKRAVLLKTLHKDREQVIALVPESLNDIESK